MRTGILAGACALALAVVATAAPAAAQNTVIRAAAAVGPADSTETIFYGPYDRAARAEVNYQGSRSWASTDPTDSDFGPVIRLFSSLTSPVGGNTFQGYAVGQFEDFLNFSAFAPGTSGVATYELALDGLVGGSGAAEWHVGVQFYAGRQDLQRFDWFGTTGNNSFDQTVTLRVNWSAGQIIPIALNTYVDTFVRGGSTSFTDLSHTIAWAGLDSNQTTTGQNVASTPIGSASGQNYSATLAVPEPATWALMIGGFGLAGAMLRRRRAVAA